MGNFGKIGVLRRPLEAEKRSNCVRKALSKLLLCLALVGATVALPASPAQAHYDDWHQATCQHYEVASTLWYLWPSQWGGTRVTYWQHPYGYINVDVQFLSYYGQTGYECGWLGQVRTSAWIQQVCEFGYCGQGTIQAFERGQIVRHFGGPSTGWVAAYSY